VLDVSRIERPAAMQNIRMIELPKDARQQAIASIERYFRENMEEPALRSGA